MFEEEDFILSISTQDGIPIPEDNVTFSQQEYDKDTALFDFDTQIFEDFLDDSSYFQFEDDAILDFTDENDPCYDSPLLHNLINKECTLDDLNVNAKAVGTYEGTYTAVRSFNRFWRNHPYDVQTEPSLCAIQYKFNTYDGFEALCNIFHDERNVLLSHYVVKMVPAFKKKVIQNDAWSVYNREWFWEY